MENVLRPMRPDELKGLSVNGVPGVNLNRSKRKKNAREKFEIELQKQEKKANQDRRPFARHVAREDFNQAIKVQIDKQLREYGSVEKPEELKLPVIDWNKYSDLKNFDKIDEKEVSDNNLSKENPGLSVKIKAVTYKYKGYGQTYKMMEPGPEAIARAVKNRAKLDKTISQDLDKEDKNK